MPVRPDIRWLNYGVAAAVFIPVAFAVGLKLLDSGMIPVHVVATLAAYLAAAVILATVRWVNHRERPAHAKARRR